LWWGKGDGTFSAPSHLTSPGETDEIQSFAIADLNNDGKLDVVVNTGTNLSSFMGCVSGSSWFYKNTGGNNFSLLWNLNGGCSFLVPIDMNGDLNEDLIFHNGDPDAGWFYGVLGNGNGTLGKSFSYPSFPNQVGGAIYVRDLNLDSRDDYILGDETFGGVAVALQTGGLKNCPPPSSASLAAKICTPASGSHSASPVLVRASGNSPAGVIQLQVWIDGVKKAVKWHGQVAQKFNLSHGTHRVTVVATDKYMGTVKKSVSVTVP
jgi:FG-GAP-like repeat